MLDTLRVSARFGIGILANSSNMLHNTSNNRYSATVTSTLSVVITPLMHNHVPALISGILAYVAPNSDISVLIASRNVTIGPTHPRLTRHLRRTNVGIISVR